MKITNLRTLLLSVKSDHPTALPTGTWHERRNLVVYVDTDAGIRGSGEIWINFPAWGCDDRIHVVREVLKPMLIGQTLDDPVRLYHLMAQKVQPLARRWHAPGPISHAVAGVDIALWDAFARQQKKSLRAAINERAGDSVRVYASGVGPGRVAATIEEATANGHDRFKLRLVSGPEDDRVALYEAREAAGAMRLMVDPAESYCPQKLEMLWSDILTVGVDWLEEPFATDRRDQYEILRTWPGRPRLALGESNYGVGGITGLIDNYAPEIVQPDITKTGGISEGREIARTILEGGLEFVPHMLGGPIGFMASANLVAATDGASLLELDEFRHETYEVIFGGFPELNAGIVTLPDSLGHGGTVDEARLSPWVSAV